MHIKIDSNPSQETLNRLGVFQWPIWTKEKSIFTWTYDQEETCFFLEGIVQVTLQNGQNVEIKKGNLVIFPKGLSCTWRILSDVKKHYKFE